jgi:hypothetical protein
MSGCASGGPSIRRTLTTVGLCLLCKLLPTLFAVSRGHRDRVGDLGPGSDSIQKGSSRLRVVRGVSGQGLGGSTLSDAASAVGVEYGVYVERCPFDGPTFRGAAKMRADARHRTAALFEGDAG